MAKRTCEYPNMAVPIHKFVFATEGSEPQRCARTKARGRILTPRDAIRLIEFVVAMVDVPRLVPRPCAVHNILLVQCEQVVELHVLRQGSSHTISTQYTISLRKRHATHSGAGHSTAFHPYTLRSDKRRHLIQHSYALRRKKMHGPPMNASGATLDIANAPNPHEDFFTSISLRPRPHSASGN